MRLEKEDNMTIDGAILTADSHGDKFQCNTPGAEILESCLTGYIFRDFIVGALCS